MSRAQQGLERAAIWARTAVLPLAGALTIWAGQVLGSLLRWAFAREQRLYAYAFCTSFLLCVAVFVSVWWALFGAAAIFVGWSVATQTDPAG
jgi:hypothetical protein